MSSDRFQWNVLLTEIKCLMKWNVYYFCSAHHRPKLWAHSSKAIVRIVGWWSPFQSATVVFAWACDYRGSILIPSCELWTVIQLDAVRSTVMTARSWKLGVTLFDKSCRRERIWLLAFHCVLLMVVCVVLACQPTSVKGPSALSHVAPPQTPDSLRSAHCCF